MKEFRIMNNMACHNFRYLASGLIMTAFIQLADFMVSQTSRRYSTESGGDQHIRAAVFLASSGLE